MVLLFPGLELFHPYATPANADRTDKPVVDMFAPLSTIRREDWGKDSEAATYGSIIHNSLAHMMQLPEQVPYTDTYSTADINYLGLCAANLWGASYFLARLQAGSLNYNNPRTRWAHNICFWAQMMRCNIFWLIGGTGYFYTYEFCYTYVPGLRIADPSIEGWKRTERGGQTTFLARNVASLWLIPAHAFYTRGFKRSVAWWGVFFFINNGYEYGRIAVWNNPVQLGLHTSEWGAKKAKFGQLVPTPKNEIDPDTNRPFNAAQNKYNRYGAKGDWQLDIWENQNHNYAPFVRRGTPIPNPYYNPLKAPKGWDRDPFSPRGREEANRPSLTAMGPM